MSPGKIFPNQSKIAQGEKSRFEKMLEESKYLAELIKISPTAIIDIYTAGSDWEFILKIDALLEAAVKKVIKANLTGEKTMDKGRVEKFIDALPMNGRSSLIELLKATGCAASEIALIESVRRLRNGFAHDITQVGSSLLDVIKRRNDKSKLLYDLSYIEEFDEAAWVKTLEETPRMLRFTIVHGTMVFLIMAYHGNLKQLAAKT